MNRGSKNPLYKSRVCTNAPFISIPLLSLTILIGILIYAVTNSFENSFVSSNFEIFLKFIINHDKMVTYIMELLESDIKPDKFSELLYLLPWFTYLGGFIYLCLLFIVRWLPKCCIQFLIICICIMVLLALANRLCKILLEIPQIYASSNMLDILTKILNSIGFLILFVIAIVIMININPATSSIITTIIKPFKKSLRALFFYPALIAFGIIILMIQLSTIFLMAWCIQKWLGTFTLLKLIMFIGGTYINLFFYYFGKMVIYEAVGTWYWVEDKEIPGPIILRCINTVIRYHLGSIAFGATFILPVYVGTNIILKNKSYKPQKDGIITQITCAYYLIVYNTDYALIQTALHGLGYFEASEKTFLLMFKSSASSLALTLISKCFLMIVALISFVIYEQNFLLDKYSCIYCYFYMLQPVFMLAEASFQTTLLCMLEDEDDNETWEEEVQNFSQVNTRY